MTGPTPSLSGGRFQVAAGYQPLLREVGLDADAVFDHPDLRAWRILPDRENCTLDATRADGTAVRLHVKRHAATRGRPTPADVEAAGIRLLQDAGIPTVPLVGWGHLADGRSFLISEDLAGYQAADKLIAAVLAGPPASTLAGRAFEALLEPTAALAAKLHAAGLHHRDLYLCHFFARSADGDATPVVPPAPADLRLIDAARVRPLPGWLTRRRWIVKDLSQFWYSTQSLPVTEDQRTRWLDCYAALRGLSHVTTARLRRAVECKSSRIARHDRNLRTAQPGRNVSIPES